MTHTVLLYTRDIDLIQQNGLGRTLGIPSHSHLFLQHECCNHGHIKGATLLLDYGAFINAPGFDNDTPLHDAVANGRVEIASLLVARGADVLLR